MKSKNKCVMNLAVSDMFNEGGFKGIKYHLINKKTRALNKALGIKNLNYGK